MANFITHYLENRDKSWDYYELCGNPQVNLDIIKEFPQVYEFSLSENTNLTWDYIVNKKNKMNWNRISSNPNITWDIVLDNPQYPWDVNGLALNPNLTWDIVEQYPNGPQDKKEYNISFWNYKYLSRNKMMS